MIASVVALVGGCSLGFWQSTTPVPIVSVPVAPTGEVFSEWSDEKADNCKWWNGTYYFDTIMCNSFSVTRTGHSDITKALDRANRCAAHGATNCVLNGEIGFAVPTAFIYDDKEIGLRMLIAPRFLDLDTDNAVKTIKLQDPNNEHPNQLFSFNTTVRVEYLKGGSRSLETTTLNGQDAYCLQSLRRSVVPSCWEGLD
jgi:hypothetical protein